MGRWKTFRPIIYTKEWSKDWPTTYLNRSPNSSWSEIHVKANQLLRQCLWSLWSVASRTWLYGWKVASSKFEEKFVKKASTTPYILETQCEHWASAVINFVSATSIQDFIQDSMDPLLALIYFITSQSQSWESLTFASNSTVRFL